MNKTSKNIQVIATLLLFQMFCFFTFTAKADDKFHPGATSVMRLPGPDYVITSVKAKRDGNMIIASANMKKNGFGEVAGTKGPCIKVWQAPNRLSDGICGGNGQWQGIPTSFIFNRPVKVTAFVGLPKGKKDVNTTNNSLVLVLNAEDKEGFRLR